MNISTPRHEIRGIQDLSGRVVPMTPEGKPQNLALIYIVQPKGTTEPIQLSADKAIKMFGDELFDSRSKFYKHTNAFAQGIAEQGSEMYFHRLVPPGSKNAKVTLYTDILEKDGVVNVKHIVTKENMEDLDEQGNPVVKIKEGTFEIDGVKSTMYPVVTFTAREHGKYYENLGIGIEPLVGDKADEEAIKDGIFKYAFSMYSKTKTGKKIVNTIMGDTSMVANFIEDSVDPVLGIPDNLEDTFIKSWYNETEMTLPYVPAEFDKPVVHYDSIKELLTIMFNAEKAAVDVLPIEDQVKSDLYEKNVDEHYNVINFVTLKNSNGNPYNKIVKYTGEVTLSDIQKEIDLSSRTPFYLMGGDDGDVSLETFELLVQEQMDRFLDPSDRIQNMTLYPFTALYDSGFKLETKVKLCNFIALRKNTHLSLATYTWNKDNKPLTLTEEATIASILKTKVKLMPESIEFGTGTVRADIEFGSAFVLNSPYKYRLPMTYEIACKDASYMGASNGKWKTGKRYDRAPGSIVKFMYDVKPNFIPDTIKNKLWSLGLNYPLPYDRRTMFYPGLQTVYDDDTSVLNSRFVSKACCTLEMINDDAWKEFSGSTDLSGPELAEAVVNYVNNRVNGIFDDMFVIEPKVVITERDKLKGYSWHLIVTIYANNMKTVMVSKIESRRLSDLNNG